MKIRFFCDSGANANSQREEVLDVEDIGYTADEWNALSDEEKQKEAEFWADQKLDIGWEEV